ncbi:hypothetical protein halTADL_3015 [Halohasta litchfieldiae]|jgi:hypothetical protein|uniref:DUF7312 domain-containing protein n=1 Tax=Halohasta litchfieldiae TaxID=1073996 RepID=A0A1H6RMM7_9EURY|nr:hypothetical protein [Halohasta litchfieldiae]ATW89718.1 hypothetical protein halTADL_3015 [Halohasta litchfieldiae]SEI53787.1 hypothetical protein SAMN05444271_102111 [Halohasta litchfieldiae]
MSQGPTAEPESEPAAESEDGEWRFSVDDVGPEADPEPPEPEPVEPESISLEHAVFVGLGIMLTVGIILTGL